MHMVSLENYYISHCVDVKALAQVTKGICSKIPEPLASGWQYLFPRHTCVSWQKRRVSNPAHWPTVLLCFRDDHTKVGLMWKLLTPELGRLIVLENRGAHSPWPSKPSWLQGVPAISLGLEFPQLISTCTHVYSDSWSLICMTTLSYNWLLISARDNSWRPILSTHLFNYFLQAKVRSHQGFDADRDAKMLNKACKGMGMKDFLFIYFWSWLNLISCPTFPWSSEDNLSLILCIPR